MRVHPASDLVLLRVDPAAWDPAELDTSDLTDLGVRFVIGYIRASDPQLLRRALDALRRESGAR